MKRIKSKDTLIELSLRKLLWAHGYRYRKNYNKIYGKPDICFPSYKIAIFCDSSFWHGREFEQIKCKRLKQNRSYWIEKVEKNIKRDLSVNNYLVDNGWIVLRFWDIEIMDKEEYCLNQIIDSIKLRKLK